MGQDTESEWGHGSGEYPSLNLRVADGVLDRLAAHARQCSPEEACGFLVGHGNTANRYLPTVNALRSRTAFAVAPEFLFRMFESLRASGEDMVAVCHSHPSSPAVLSKRDIAGAHYPDAAHVVVSLVGPRPEIRAYRVVQDEAIEIALHGIV